MSLNSSKLMSTNCMSVESQYIRITNENLVRSIDVKREFPFNVFIGNWGKYLFFDSDLLFQDQFISKLSVLFRADGSVCACMSNLDEAIVFRGKTENPNLIIATTTTGDEYTSCLCGAKAGDGWIYCMDRFGIISNEGQWCIYCEKRNEIAVIAIRGDANSTVYQSAIELFGGFTIKDAIEKQVSYGFTPHVLSNKWQKILMKQYKDTDIR